MAVFFVPMCFVALVLSACGMKEGAAWQDDKDFVIQSLAHMDEVQSQRAQHEKLSDKRIFDLEKKVAQQQVVIDALMASVKAQKKGDLHITSTNKQRLDRKDIVKKKLLTEKIDKLDSDIQQSVVQAKSDYQLAEKNDYTAAYLALKSGRYDEAISSFQTFLNVYPSGEYADQAYYWLGESLLAKSNFSAAAEAFNTLIQTFPKSSKYRVGLLKLATAYEQEKRLGDAKAVLQRVLDEAPKSKEAEQAKVRLTALKHK